MYTQMKVSIGILTHRSPVTLFNTFLSYQASGLLECTDDIFCIIQPSDKQDQEVECCNHFQVRAVVEKENGMMAWGIKRVFEEAKYENVLFLESDFRCLRQKETIQNLLSYALQVLETKEADVVRLRSLKKAGHPLQINHFKGNELSSPDHIRQLYVCTHYLEHPEDSFPDAISVVKRNPLIYRMSSKHCVYTNNPTLVTKEFFTQSILPYIQFGKHLEPEIDTDWATKYTHTIYITEGLFTHVRLDGHEGKNCWCCPRRYGGTSDISSCICCRGEHYDPKPFQESDISEALA
jgi:hypothetical protein